MSGTVGVDPNAHGLFDAPAPGSQNPVASTVASTLTAPLLFNDVLPSLWPTYGQFITLDYFAGAGTFTLPAQATIAYPIDYFIVFFNAGANTVTFAAATGASLTSIAPNSPKNLAPGAIAIARVQDTNGQWILGGNLTV